MGPIKHLFSAILIATLSSCNPEKEPSLSNNCLTENFFSEFASRNFSMGFSTWAYAPTTLSVNDTYAFISNNSDIYSEHIDDKIPWNTWMNNLALPTEFTNEIDSRIEHKMPHIKLALSVSLLNTERNNLAQDVDGSTPEYSAFNDQKIEDAYYKHLYYLVNRFEPEYLIIALEVNELKIKAPDKWEAYKLLIANVKARIQAEFPLIKISESITLHNLYEPDVADRENYINEMVDYANFSGQLMVDHYFFKIFAEFICEKENFS